MDKKNKNLGVPPAEADGGPPSGLGRSASLPDRPSRLRRGSAGNALLRTAPVRPNAKIKPAIRLPASKPLSDSERGRGEVKGKINYQMTPLP
jgi:hypothetical protein